ncbi:hypothetical protein GCM10017673_26220 [Streptosporangium violaceochromogenes]|nr:hypothetical protein GCM10017673_26220 [Streptosporangium violaceochromogenes]
MGKRSATAVLLAITLAGAAGPAAYAATPSATPFAASSATGAAAKPAHHWGPVRSATGHAGHARADVWLTDFSAETFVVSGTLHDRDAHPGHCAYIRARFHYTGGGTGWARPRSTCAASGAFRLSSDGKIRRVDVRVCLVNRTTREVASCHTDPVKAETVANWPR